MLDHLRLAIPVYPIYTRSIACKTGKLNYFIHDLLNLGLRCSSRSVSRLDDGTVLASDLYIPYESLPSSYTDMAIKFFDAGRNCLPYLELKASPAKLLQGHNIYGSQWIAQGVYEMLGLVVKAYPKLLQYLDFSHTEVLHLDTTFSARLPNQAQVQPVLDFLANVGKGHRKATYKAHENYIRWGNDKATIAAKAYGKYLESKQQLAELKKLAEAGDARAHSCQLALQKAYPFSQGLLRFEARVSKTYLSRNHYPTNVWDLLLYQERCPDLLADLWHVAFDPIFDALKGEQMIFKNNDDIEKLLRTKLVRLTPKGRKSYTQANAAMNFYRTLKDKGFAVLHKEMRAGLISEPTFYRNLKLLTDCGISRSHLQNLHNDKAPKLVPFVQLVKIDFSQQVPLGFVEPVSQFSHLFHQAA